MDATNDIFVGLIRLLLKDGSCRARRWASAGASTRMPLTRFISSVQKEPAEDRRALKRYIQGDALLGRFFGVFLFEDMPAIRRCRPSCARRVVNSSGGVPTTRLN